MKQLKLFLLGILFFFVGWVNGQGWEEANTNSLNSLITPTSPNEHVFCMAYGDATTGTSTKGYVYAAGDFKDANGKHFVARYDIANNSWSQLGNIGAATTGRIRSIAADELGHIYVAGDFGNSNHRYVASWNGTSWVQLGTQIFDNTITKLSIDRNGNLYVSGLFNYIAKWNGSIWTTISLDPSFTGPYSNVPAYGYNYGTLVYADVNGPTDELYVAHSVTPSTNNSSVYAVFKLNSSGNGWIKLGDGSVANGINMNNSVQTILSLTTDNIGNVYASSYAIMGAFPIAKWDNSPNTTSWTPVITPYYGLNNTSVFDLHTDKNGNIYTHSYTGGYANTTPYDLASLKLVNGSTNWEKISDCYPPIKDYYYQPSANDPIINSIVTDKLGNVYMSGFVRTNLGKPFVAKFDFAASESQQGQTPLPTVSPTNLTICSNNTQSLASLVTINGNNNPNSVILWYTSATGGIATATSPTPSGTTSVDYWVSVRQYCKQESDRVKITVNFTSPSFTVSANPSSVCVDSTTTLTASNNNYTYTWTVSYNGGTATNIPCSTACISITHTPNAAGTYTYTATANENGCTSTKNISVIVSAPEETDQQDQTVCKGNSIKVDPSPYVNGHWVYATPSQNPHNITFTQTQSGVATITGSNVGNETLHYYYTPQGQTCPSYITLNVTVENCPPACSEDCYWTLHGNTVGTDCNEKYIGTNNEADLRFRTNHDAGNTAMMRLDAGGNLSIEPYCNANAAANQTNLMVGSGNTVDSKFNTVLGERNQIAASTNCLAVGYSNYIGPNQDKPTNSFVTGSNNRILDGSSSAIFGMNLLSQWSNNFHLGASGKTNFMNSVPNTFMVGWNNDNNFTDENKGTDKHTLLVNSEGLAIKTASKGLNVPVFDMNDDDMDMATARLDVYANSYTITKDDVSKNRKSGVRFRELPPGKGQVLVIDDHGYIFKTGNSAEKINNNNAEIEMLKTQIAELQTQVKALLEARNYSPCTVAQPSGTLEIVPTPFADNAKAIYSIDNFSGEASLQIADMNGKVLKTFAINQAKGQIEIGAIQTTTSTVVFTIVSGGKVVVSKKSIKVTE